VLAGAGGTLESADLAHLRRVPRGSGQAETFDLDGYLQRGGPAPAIEPGDVLVVPTRTVLGPSVRVVGAVVKPGAVQLGRDTDLQQALALAGGPAPGADLRQIRVFAAGAEPGAASVVDLEAILRDADLARLKPLAEGDTVFVPKAREAADPNAAAVTVYVFGAVARPGAYPLKDNRSVLAALAQAGGLLPTADGEQVTITRGPAATGERRARFNFRAYQSGETTPVPTVADGDMVEVPVNEVTLVGQVVRVGPVALRPGATVVEALAAGGGPTKDADLTRISLTRRTPEGPRREMVDLRAYLVPGGNLPALPVVRAGDVIHLEAGVSESLAVLVVGAVARPGPVSVTGEGASILSVLAQAGGAAATADRSAVRVLRPAGDKVQHLTCDLQALLTGKADAPLRVLPGDVVNVEDLGRPGKGVLVLGGVQRQGWVNILTPTQTVMETLGQAGGLTPQGLHAPTHLVRANGEVTTLDLGALSRRGVPTPVVREGDTLIFAQRNPQARSLWDDILRMIPIVSWFWRP
jgi:protein involved in polysaccharide export with SLBB domain